jgi:hypothetical protein
MEKVEVTACSDKGGNMIPVRMIWNGQVYEIGSTGRQWVDEEGQHILIMFNDGRVLELLYEQDKNHWYLIRKIKGRSFA